MKIIITSGGTSERIDNIRKITNRSSGLLGSMIANELVAKNDENLEKIYYISNKNAKKPYKNDKIKEIIAESTEDVYNALENLVPKCDAIIHAMAISDYKVDYVSSSQLLTQKLAGKSKNEIEKLLISNDVKIANNDKISSYNDDLFIRLVPTPKIISKIKEWNKSILLVGFKLLSNVREEKLADVATNLLRKTNCDLVVANDITKITKERHPALIIDKNSNVVKVNTKDYIAKIISQYLLDNPELSPTYKYYSV